MRRKTIGLLLTWALGAAVMLGCKGDEVNPVDKLMGLYQGGFYPKGVIILNVGSNIRLQKNNDLVRLTVFNVLFQKILIPATGGFEERYKDFDYPNCKVLFLDTLGANNPTQPFAKIINTDNNTELGEISNRTYYPEGIETKYYQLNVDFFVADTVKISRTRFKWQD